MNIFDRTVSLFEADYTEAKNWLTGEALPFLENFLKTTVEEEVVALKPIVEAELGKIAADIPALLAGGLPAVWALAAQIGAAVIPQIIATGQTVAIASVQTAVAAGIANLQASAIVQPTASTTEPDPTPAPVPSASS